MLKSKITRGIALLLSCILVGVFAGNVMYLVAKSRKMYEGYNDQFYTVSSYVNEIYYKLWLISAIWLRNLDPDGNFKGTAELKKQTVDVLKKSGCMDAYGNIMLDDCYSEYEYLLSYGENTFSNTSRSFEQLDDEYAVKRKNDSIYFNHYESQFNNSSCNIYDSDFGMHYYCTPYQNVALFDYDISGLDSYVDEYGATIYYKDDGSTPLPNVVYDSAGYGTKYVLSESDEEYFEYDVTTVYNEPDTYEDEIDSEGNNVSRGTLFDGLYMYDSETDSFIRVKENEIEDDDTEPATQQPRKTFEYTLAIESPITIIIRPSDEIISNIKDYDSKVSEYEKDAVHSAVNFLVLLIIALILAVYVIAMGGYDCKTQKFVMGIWDKIYAEVYIAVILAGCAFCIILIDRRGFYNFFDDYYTTDVLPVFFGALFAVLFCIILLATNSIIVRIKCHDFWKHTLIWIIICAVHGLLKKIWSAIRSAHDSLKKRRKSDSATDRDMFRNDKFTNRFVIRTVIFTAIGFVLNMFFVQACFWSGMVFTDFILIFAYSFLSLKDLKSINNISKHITAISEGDYSSRPEDVTSPACYITQKLNNISSGMQDAVDRQVKSERMKIDLVTNVSHDLKTPLTSIISYIDLLSAEELSPVARDYVNIINNKSQRLKDMVADLFDLAKATSRTDIDMEKIDAVILINQVIADMSDKIESSGRQIKLNMNTETASIMADGKKMYRVAQNLIDNALKYSLDNTRIYISLESEFGYCCITVKNIASYEMNFAPDEIMERFTRGDESRTTDGNGLGLSIAKNFTEACGGTFSISIDGDLFIASIKLPVII